jgi:hypothetical protein
VLRSGNHPNAGTAGPKAAAYGFHGTGLAEFRTSGHFADEESVGVKHPVFQVICVVVAVGTSTALAQTTKSEPPYWFDDPDSKATIYFLSSDDVAGGGYVGIYGDDFLGGGQVTLGGTSVPVSVWSARRVIVQIPTGSVSGPLVVRPTGGTASDPRNLVVHGGRILHLDPNAPSGGNGSASSPWRDFASADAGVTPGDFVMVHAGTFSNSDESVWYGKKAGAAGNSITYFVKPGDVVVVDGSSAVKSALRSDAAYVNFVGFVARGSKYQNVNLDGAYTRAVDCEVKDGDGTVTGKGQGINVTGTGAKALGNYVHDNYSHGFYVHADDGEIAYNYVAGSGCCGSPASYGYGIQVYLVDPGPVFARMKVYRNYVTSSKRSGVVVGLNADQTDVYENIVTGNQERGLIVNYGATKTRLRNNVAYANDRAAAGYYQVELLQGTDIDAFNNAISGANGLAKRSTAVGIIRIDGNIYDGTSRWIWDPTTYTSLAAWRAGTGVDGSSQTADPKFQNPGASDFRPQGTSPMIDSGIDAQCARPVLGTHCDEGAFEATSSGGSSGPAAPTNLRRTDRRP